MAKDFRLLRKMARTTERPHTVAANSSTLANGRAAGADRELARIIHEEQLTTLFQPIVSTADGRIYGYEALVRGPSDSPLHSPRNLFDTAHRQGLLIDLEVACWRLAYRRFIQLGLPGKLFLNVCPHTLLDPQHKLSRGLMTLDRTEFAPRRMVIELTEQAPVDDYQGMTHALLHYRELGFEIAIDDLGAGYAGLRLWSELRPDYVKIDAHFVQRIHEDGVKQEFVRSIRDIALSTKCRVIAEGVETREEFEAVGKLNIVLAQGYFFARPHARPSHELPAALRPSDAVNNTDGQRQRLSETIAALAVPISPATPETLLEQMVERLQRDPELHTVPVVEGERALGVIRRSRVMELFLRQFGRELYGRRPISRFMDQNPVVVEYDFPVERVSQQLTNKLNFEVEHDFLITRNGHYYGVGRLRDLLKTITDLQIRNARYANPLTLLPGNVPIYEHIDHLLESREPFTVCYCDLDNFKPFNDAYGYSKGDEVIQKTAQVLSSHIDTNRDFLGHIGGDDFILIFTSSDWRERCEHVLRHFSREIHALYRTEDQAAGGIWSHDRSGNPVFFPMLSLSIGAVAPDPQRCSSHHEVATLASDAKHEAKQIPGNSLFVNRRRGPLQELHEETAVEDAGGGFGNLAPVPV